MCFELLYVIFVVVAILNYIFLDIKVDKIKKERSLDRDKVMGSLTAHNSVLRKLNEGYKDHERRINDIQRFLLPEEPENTCENCKFYDLQYGPVFKCKKLGCTYVSECNKACQLFEKKEDLDEDENVVYANNVKIDISSKKEPRVYKLENQVLLTPADYADHITKLYLDGGINFADASALLERLKQ